MKDWEAGLWER